MNFAPFHTLDELSDAGKSLVREERQPFALEARQQVIHCGQAVEGTYFVTSGELRVYIQDTEGRERTLYHIRPGQTCILAVNSTFSGLLYPAWVASGETAVTGFFLPAAVYRRLFDSEPALRYFTIQVLTTWIYDLLTSIEESSLLSLPERLAHAIVRRVDRRGVARGTHHDLARDLGTAREVVSRHLAAFEERGLLERGRGFVRVPDPQQLLSESLRS